MPTRLSYRGGPLIALVAVLLVWIVMRVMVSAPTASTQTHSSMAGTDALYQALLAANGAQDPQLTQTERLGESELASASVGQGEPAGSPGSVRSYDAVPDRAIEYAAVEAPLRQVLMPSAPRERYVPVALNEDTPYKRQVTSHFISEHSEQGYTRAESTSIKHQESEPERKGVLSILPRLASKDWSADGWYMLRSGGADILANGAHPATYGASQVGGVLRYSIAPQSAHRSEAYARIAAALNTVQDREAALGLSARPFPSIPVRGAVELRISDQLMGTSVRPAAMAITEFAPFVLPYKSRAEFYAQAGYVGGRYSTAFLDGQARWDRAITWLGSTELRAGLGAWGGAQKGASRFDIGPSATLALKMGQRASARLALDWRMRVAGNAKPDTGLALTLSAGF